MDGWLVDWLLTLHGNSLCLLQVTNIILTLAVGVLCSAGTSSNRGSGYKTAFQNGLGAGIGNLGFSSSPAFGTYGQDVISGSDNIRGMISRSSRKASFNPRRSTSGYGQTGSSGTGFVNTGTSLGSVSYGQQPQRFGNKASTSSIGNIIGQNTQPGGSNQAGYANSGLSGTFAAQTPTFTQTGRLSNGHNMPSLNFVSSNSQNINNNGYGSSGQGNLFGTTGGSSSIGNTGGIISSGQSSGYGGGSGTGQFRSTNPIQISGLRNTDTGLGGNAVYGSNNNKFGSTGQVQAGNNNPFRGNTLGGLSLNGLSVTGQQGYTSTRQNIQPNLLRRLSTGQTGIGSTGQSYGSSGNGLGSSSITNSGNQGYGSTGLQNGLNTQFSGSGNGFRSANQPQTFSTNLQQGYGRPGQQTGLGTLSQQGSSVGYGQQQQNNFGTVNRPLAITTTAQQSYGNGGQQNSLSQPTGISGGFNDQMPNEFGSIQSLGLSTNGQQSYSNSGQNSGLGTLNQLNGGSSGLGNQQSFSQPRRFSTGMQQGYGNSGQISGVGTLNQLNGGSSGLGNQQSISQPRRFSTSMQQGYGNGGQISGVGTLNQLNGGSSGLGNQQSFSQPRRFTTGVQQGYGNIGSNSLGTQQQTGFGSISRPNGLSSTGQRYVSSGQNSRFGPLNQGIGGSTGIGQPSGFPTNGQQSYGNTGQTNAFGTLNQPTSGTMGLGNQQQSDFGNTIGQQGYGNTGQQMDFGQSSQPRRIISSGRSGYSSSQQTGFGSGGQVRDPMVYGNPNRQTSLVNSGQTGYSTGQQVGLGGTFTPGSSISGQNTYGNTNQLSG